MTSNPTDLTLAPIPHKVPGLTNLTDPAIRTSPTALRTGLAASTLDDREALIGCTVVFDLLDNIEVIAWRTVFADVLVEAAYALVWAWQALGLGLGLGLAGLGWGVEADFALGAACWAETLDAVEETRLACVVALACIGSHVVFGLAHLASDAGVAWHALLFTDVTLIGLGVIAEACYALDAGAIGRAVEAAGKAGCTGLDSRVRGSGKIEAREAAGTGSKLHSRASLYSQEQTFLAARRARQAACNIHLSNPRIARQASPTDLLPKARKTAKRASRTSVVRSEHEADCTLLALAEGRRRADCAVEGAAWLTYQHGWCRSLLIYRYIRLDSLVLVYQSGSKAEGQHNHDVTKSGQLWLHRSLIQY